MSRPTFLHRAACSLLSDPLMLVVLAGSFLSRWLIADRNSYWLDELYSVATYGAWNDSALDAVRALAATSVHPPLYQFTLYHWMSWFGDSEVATRSLSNLYVTLAALFLYLALRYSFSRRLALASVIAFSLMYTTMYYGLETRSYAQTIFLVTLSSYLLLRIMKTAAAGQSWRPALISPVGVVFTWVNVALLMTHYYNVFFWVAQGITAGVFVLRERPPRQWFAGLGVVAGIYGLQGALFTLAWGQILAANFRLRAERFSSVAGDLQNPLELLFDSVVRANIDAPRAISWVGLAIAAIVLIRSLTALARRNQLTDERRRAWTVVYLGAWLILPLVVVYIAFSIMGVARYNARYFIFSVVPLAPLLVLAVEEVGRALGEWLERIRGARLQHRLSTVLMIIVAATVILPGTYAAATSTKADWRGTARAIVAIIESNPRASYVVYEPEFLNKGVLDYYLGRFSDDVRVAGSIPEDEERRGNDFSFERTAAFIEEHDFLIVPFIHHRISDFPIALERLGQIYRIQHWQIDDSGMGLVIFSTSPSGEPSNPVIGGHEADAGDDPGGGTYLAGSVVR